TRGFFDDREAHARSVAMLFRHFAPAGLSLAACLERAFDLRRAFHELVEVHRTELAADHPEIAAFGHCQSPHMAFSSEVESGSREENALKRKLALAELVHRIVGAPRLQRGFAGEVLLVIVADVG